MRKIVMSLVALGFLTAPVLMLQGCSVDTGDNYDQSGQDHSYSYVFTEGDRDYGTGTPLFCTDSNCSVINSDDTDDNSINKGEADAIVGVYSEDYTQAECNAAGYFFCTIQDKCLNQPVDDASSSCGG